MPGDAAGEDGPVETIEGIPLYLIPRTIADQIRIKRKAIRRILVERRFQQQYTVKVETLEDQASRKDTKNPDDTRESGTHD